MADWLASTPSTSLPMSPIGKYVQRSTDMLADDQERDKLFQGIDDMWHGNWDLPNELKGKPDLRPIVDMSPHDALKSGSAILSTSMPHWTVEPQTNNEGELQKAKNIAYAIDYAYRRMNGRGKSTILWDIVHSALRYDAVAIWLDYLPWVYKGRKPTLRERHALRKGNYVPTVYNPQNVHIQSDEYGLNCVLLCVNMAAQEVVQKWPVRATDLAERLKNENDTGLTRFIYHDLMIYENDKIRRVVWGSITSSYSVLGGNDEYVIMNDFTDLPFMPWIVQVGGSALEDESEYTVHPLLGPLYTSHKWKDLCAFQSIYQSEIIKYGRTPRVITITPSGDGVIIDFNDGTSVNLRTGEDAKPWTPAPIDPNLGNLVDRVRAEVSSMTLPRILQNPEFAGNTPFASINAMIQTALGGLNPAKTLCERVHEELALRMMEWSVLTNNPMEAVRNQTSTDENMGMGSNVTVMPDQMNPDAMVISCKLFAEAPTDFQQRLQAAVVMNQQLHIPLTKVVADLGMENVDSLMDEWAQEQENNAALQLDLAQQKAQLDLQVQQQTMAMQAALQQQQQAAQQPPASGGAPGQGGGGMNAQDLGLPPGTGMNPNPGQVPQPGSNAGNSPTAGLPGVSSREMISGQDVTGAGT